MRIVLENTGAQKGYFIMNKDDKVFDIVPRSFPTYDKSVTIKHLLTHSSGIPDYYDEELMEAGVDIKLSIPNYDLNKPSDYLEIMPDKKMKFAPGKAFNYNNSAFVLLAVIIELLTGDYHLWIEKEVLQKARMISSGFFKMDQLPTNTAIGYLETDKSSNKSNIYQLPIIGGGDGGMYTTVKDMDRFWDAFLEGEIVNSNIEKTNKLIEQLTAQFNLGAQANATAKEQMELSHQIKDLMGKVLDSKANLSSCD